MNPVDVAAAEATSTPPASQNQSGLSTAVNPAANTNASSGKAAVSSSHLDLHTGRPLFMAENIKGSSGSNRWMWENAMLIMPTRDETKSSNCLGAWCLRCEELGKSAKECHLNYHPTRNFKAISRHFKRHHVDLQQQGDSKKKASKRPAVARTTTATRSPKRIKVALKPEDAIPKSHLLLDRTATHAHRIISPPAFHPCGEVVEKAKASNRKVFEDMIDMAPEQRAAVYVEEAGLSTADDMMLFLQGGPGFGSPTPMASLSFEKHSSWAARALDQYSRVVLMDQRGTGRSSPITKQSLQKWFPDLFLLDGMVNYQSRSLDELGLLQPEVAKKVETAVDAATEFLEQFRADSIVQDAEAAKDALIQKSAAVSAPWGCALGQSFGGFCIMSYLSLIVNPPKICLLTGGIAPMMTPTYDVYTSLWQRVKERNLRYYSIYPGDIPIVKVIVKALLEEPAQLPSGGLLTARRFLQMGIALGGGPSAFATVHELLSGPFLHTDDAEVEFKVSFLKRMDSFQSYDENPFYFWLHEAIYADGATNSPANWAAHHAYDDIVKSNKEYDYKYTCNIEDDAIPTLLFGEMVFPWMPDDYEELSGVGMRALSNKLASKEWGTLYNGDHMRKVLGDGACRAAAAVYYDDMYVDFNCSMKVASPGAPLEKCKVWVTNEYQHSGIKDDGAKIFAKLHGMASGSVRVPA